MTVQRPPLSLIIPCYNEAANLPGLVARCLVLAGTTGGEVILVDNGSSDDTPAVLQKLLASQTAVRSLRVDVNEGYGHGIVSGLRAAKGEVIGWTHADLQTDPMDAARALRVFQQSETPELLYVKGLRKARPLADTVFTAGMSLFETVLMGRILRDVNAQPNLMNRSVVDAWTDPPKDFSLDLFALANAKKRGLDVVRIPVLFPERIHGQSSWNVDWAAKRKFIGRTLDYSFRLRRSFARPGA
ncbi:MAG: glycosyltransferase family 2 protein [Pseudomonadota bacterium]